MKQKLLQNGLVGFLLILVSFLYGYQNILPLRPCSIHQWRQADCLSFTQNYYEEGMQFFEPKVNYISEKKTSKTVSEFPILYYLVACLWKIFGKHEIIYRLLNIAIVFAGLLLFFRGLNEILNDFFWASFITLFLFSSPVLVYYTNNFLTNAPAFGLSLAAWYYFHRFYLSCKNKYLYFSMILFLLAGLLKISSLIGYVVILLIFLAELFNNISFQKESKIFYSPRKQIIPIALVIVGIISWYCFAINYNKNNGMFLQGILPIWNLDFIHIKHILHEFRINILPQIYYNKIVYALILLAIGAAIFYKKNYRILNFITWMLAFGSVAFGILWFQVFDVHDYYLLDLLILPVFILLSVIVLLKRNYFNVYKSIIMKGIAFLILAFNIYYCAVYTRIKYDSNDKMASNSYLLTKWGLDKTWKKTHYNYDEHIKPMETITPYLRSIGISREDTVISLPDPSPDITLYLMDQKGFTDFGYNDIKNENRLKHFIAMGAKYLIISDDSVKNVAYIKPFLQKKIGNYQHVDVYDLTTMK